MKDYMEMRLILPHNQTFNTLTSSYAQYDLNKTDCLRQQLSKESIKLFIHWNPIDVAEFSFRRCCRDFLMTPGSADLEFLSCHKTLTLQLISERIQ